MATPTTNTKRVSTGVRQWILTTADATGTKVTSPLASDRCVQTFGSFGAGTINMEGSNEEVPLNWAPLHDPQGTAITFTAAGIKQILENPLHIRATLTGSTGASVTVLLHQKGN